MSVASADPNQPSFSANGKPVENNLGTNWTLGSEGLYKLTNPDTTQNQPSLTIGMYGNGTKLGKFGNDVAQGIFSTNGIGVKIPILRADLYSAGGLNKTLTFNFSSAGDNYALMLKDDSNSSQSLESLQIWGQNANGNNANNATSTSTFVGKFGGKGILGNILINTVAKKAQFNFEKNANLEGLIIIEQGSGDGKTPDRGNSFIFGNGGIKGSVIAVTGNSSSNAFSFDSTRSNGDAHISGGILVANGTGDSYKNHSFVFKSSNKSQVVISGALQDKKPTSPSDNSWDKTHGLSEGQYAIVVRGDNDSNARNSHTRANFYFETDAKVGKVLAVNYQTTIKSNDNAPDSAFRSIANYTIRQGKKVTFNSIESKKKGDTTITLESGASATVLNGILTDSSGTNTISLGGDATFNIQGGTDNKITTLNLSGSTGNVLNAKSGKTTIGNLTFSGTNKNELTLNGGDTTITTLGFSGTAGNELTINGGTTNITTFNFNGSGGNSVFNANSGTTTITTLTLTSDNNTINANGGSTTITNAISLDNKTLDLGIGNGNLKLSGNLTAGNGNDGTANINFTGNGTLTSNLSVGSSNQGTININITGGNGTIAGKLDDKNSTATSGKGINIDFTGSNASLSIIDPSTLSAQNVAQQSQATVAHTISTLTATGEGNILNLSGQARNSGVLPNRTTFQTLKINDLKADSKSINFIVYANPDANNSGSNGARADRIIIEGSTSSTTSGAGTGGA
ncbi:MAG TPA: hypothetical protein IAA23_00020, partial [Candidatus Helicobacter avistercoris]|nr:hypothetical protein [Candidatus Helicobacter avistercoris]